MLKLNRILLPNSPVYQNVSYSMYKHFAKHKLLLRNSNKVFVRNKKTNVTNLFVPVHIKPNSDPAEVNVGQELTGGSIDKSEMVKVLNKFFQRQEIKLAAMDHGLDSYLQHQAYISFRRYCLEAQSLPVDLHVVMSDIIQGAGHVDDLFPQYLRHAKKMFPHLDCMDDLKKISDLRNPTEWYPNARSISRRIIFHAGPTNSGKTYHALERFLAAESGVYCGPLKMLATEVFKKSNDRGTPCDLITGEEKKFIQGEDKPANHVACTVEMTSVNVPYEVAVIDEIQMMKDVTRGWAWTRALLGLMAKEIHVCGEAGAVDLVKSIMMTTNEDVEVYKYKRLTELTIEDSAVGCLDNIQPGDCIVCFSKNDVYTVSQGLERRRKKVAVIYGSLPPTIKLAQAAKFNDPNNPCKVMVATDAIGMGLNLSIRRIVFYSVQKLFTNEAGKTEMGVISASAAHQIAGRAGRCNTQFEKGFVTTYKSEDLSTLKKLLSKTPEPITKAGLYPTSDQIEQYASHLPNARLSNLMSVFESLSIVDDSLYFLSNMETFKHLADLIQHVKIPVRTRYVFCCAPISQKMQFACKMFTKFAQQYSRRKPITVDWLCSIIDWPVSSAYTMKDLFHLESVFDVLELYLWFSYRYSDDDEFCDPGEVGGMQEELIELIREGMKRVIRLWDNIPDTSSIHDASLSLPQRRTGTYIGHRRTDFHDSNADSSYVPNNNFVSNHTPLPWIRPLESLFFMVCLAIVLYALPPPPKGMSATSPDVLVGILSILFLIIMIPILLTALSKVIKVYVKIVVALFKVMMLIIGLLLLVRIFSH